MTQETWLHQKARLIDRFGKQNFSPEFSLLVSIECKSIPDQDFVDLVNRMIGSRKPNAPPLMQDFRDARLAIEKMAFQRDIYGALKAYEKPTYQVGLRAYLAKEFPGCTSLAEAGEVRRLQIDIQRAENPNYEPMTDPKWMGER